VHLLLKSVLYGPSEELECTIMHSKEQIAAAFAQTAGAAVRSKRERIGLQSQERRSLS
jgi:hypothetical protein